MAIIDTVVSVDESSLEPLPLLLFESSLGLVSDLTSQTELITKSTLKFKPSLKLGCTESTFESNPKLSFTLGTFSNH